jgi:predicted nucleic acid-binding protein
MNYLVDTNVISELRKSNCNENVKVFIEQLPPECLYLSAISLGEISFGIKKMDNTHKKSALIIWFESQLPEWFEGRVISIDSNIAIEWGAIRAKHKETLPVSDSLLAATALTHHLTILTRNVKDFERIEGISFINSWEPKPV